MIPGASQERPRSIPEHPGSLSERLMSAPMAPQGRPGSVPRVFPKHPGSAGAVQQRPGASRERSGVPFGSEFGLIWDRFPFRLARLVQWFAQFSWGVAPLAKRFKILEGRMLCFRKPRFAFTYPVSNV